MSAHIPGEHYAIRALVGGLHEGHRSVAPKARVPKVNRSADTARYGKSEALQPVEPMQFSDDPLRPGTLAMMIGQERLKPLLRRIVDGCKRAEEPLDHVMLIGASGTGKSTLALALAHEIGTNVYQAKPPVSLTMFERLGQVMRDGDVLYIDEIHLQVSGDRRGVGQAPDPETFYHVMEDRKLITMSGPVAYPAITVIGATTDSGLLPEPFLGRFGLTLQLDRYTAQEMALMAIESGRRLGLSVTPEAAYTFADASRANPRVLNRYLRNAKALALGGDVAVRDAQEVIIDLNGTTLDGLTPGMQMMLRFLLAQAKESKGEIIYQSGVQAIATALGHSRDTKAVSLYVEPYLIERGFLQVLPNGRRLTDAGVARAATL